MIKKSTGEDSLLVRYHRGQAVVEEADKMDSDAMGTALTALGETGKDLGRRPLRELSCRGV